MCAAPSRQCSSSFTSEPLAKVPENVNAPSSFHCCAGPSATRPKKLRSKSRASGLVFQVDSDFFLPFGQNCVQTLRLRFKSCDQLQIFLPSTDQNVSAPVLRPLA